MINNTQDFGAFANEYGKSIVNDALAPLRENTKEARAMIEKLKGERPSLDPVAVDSFLEIDPKLPDMIDKAAGSIAFKGGIAGISGVALGAVLKFLPEISTSLMAFFPNLPPNIHEGLQVIHGAALNSADTQNLLSHAVTLAMDGGFFGVAASVLAATAKAGLPKIGSTQEKLQGILNLGGRESVEKIKVGGIERIKWNMAAKHTQFFGAIGDPFAKLLYASLPKNELMLYADQKPNFSNTWTKLGKVAGKAETHDAFDAGSFSNAGEFVISTSNGTHSFLPGESDFDYEPREVQDLVSSIRRKEVEDGIEPRKIVLVGDSLQKSVTTTEDALGNEIKARRSEISFDSIAAADTNVVIIDPTAVAIDAIFDAHAGRNYLFRGTPESTAKYRQQFYSRLTLKMDEYRGITNEQERIKAYNGACKAGNHGEQVEILYNIVDAPTVQEAKLTKRPDQISIVLEQQAYDELVPDKNNVPNNVVFLPELVNKKILEVVKPTEEN